MSVTVAKRSNKRLTVGGTHAELLAEVLGGDARTALVARDARMVARRVVTHVTRAAVLLQLNFAAMRSPDAVFLLLLARRSVVLARIFRREICGILQREFINLRMLQISKSDMEMTMIKAAESYLCAGLGIQDFGDGAVIVVEDFMQNAKQALIRRLPFWFRIRRLVVSNCRRGVFLLRLRVFFLPQRADEGAAFDV